jgi:putative spermidine/putrescine transport system substrate-binding protein/spermidine/putrescine transport system substrate-binding protein
MNSIGAENGFADLETYTKNTLMQSPLYPKIREQMIKDFEKIKAGY